MCIEMQCAGNKAAKPRVNPAPDLVQNMLGMASVGAKDNTAAFVLAENNTADDAAAALCRCRRHPRLHVSLCQV